MDVTQLTPAGANDKKVLRINSTFLEFTTKDLVNPDDHSFYSKIFVLAGHYGVDAIVWANNLEDALETIVDADEDREGSDKRFNQYSIDDIDLEDYDMENFPPPSLGNYGDYYDLDEVSTFEITDTDLINSLYAYAQAMGLTTEDS
jgi:hypothetical protein